MMTDRLLEIFHELLSQDQDPHETAGHLIRRVAGCYAQELQQMGEIPLSLIGEVLSDLEAEVVEIYRKTTYGHLSLQAFRQARAAQGQTPAPQSRSKNR